MFTVAVMLARRYPTLAAKTTARRRWGTHILTVPVKML